MNRLLKVQQGIELCQIRRCHDDLRRGRQRRARQRERDHRRGGQRCRVREQEPQRIVDGFFAVVSRMVQNLQIFLRGLLFVEASAELIVGGAEPRRRKQVLAVGVVGERARLPHQLVDDVPIVDLVVVAADQSRHRIHELIRVPDLDAIGVQPGFHGVANEPTVHRIDAAMKVNQTAGVDAATHLQATVESKIGQGAERGQLFVEAITAASVAGLHHFLQKHCVLIAAGEVATTTHEQCLIDGRFEMPVRRLRIAVLVGLPDIDPLAGHAVVRQQIPIARLKLSRRRQVVHRRRQAVGAMSPRYAAEFPKCVL